MTMYTLPNFCRVCLKYDKNLIDLAHIENEPSETLMTKLEQCVSEVDWTAYKPLLCHPCIKRLNVAFSFKKQCVQSAGVLKSYLELVKETQRKNESHCGLPGEPPTQPGAYMVLPNQKFVKILVGPQQQNSFQNVFLNLIPTGGMAPVPVTPPSPAVLPDALNNKDTNQNVFVNLNNTMQKFVPIAPIKASKSKHHNSAVNQLLTESKSEELSVEIDPTIYGLGDDSDSSGNDEEVNDWDEVISQSQINSKDAGKLNGDKPKHSKEKHNKGNFYGNYVPILPKHGSDFSNSGQHFLSASSCFDENEKDFSCETCLKNFATVKLLKHHIKIFHMGKYPFKCEYCYAEYVTRIDYEMCLKSHKQCNESSNTSLTLKDFTNTSLPPPPVAVQPASEPENLSVSVDDGAIYTCELCNRQFNSSTGLLRHKVRKHHQKNKKKYFIKGMKNAKCDICNREFSTQSYMQLHRKLHMRDDVGYKYKVFGKSKYSDSKDSESPSNEISSNKKVKKTGIPTTDPELDEGSESENENMDTKVKVEAKSESEDESEMRVKKEVTIEEENTEDSDDNPSKLEIDESSLRMEIDEHPLEDLIINYDDDMSESQEGDGDKSINQTPTNSKTE